MTEGILERTARTMAERSNILGVLERFKENETNFEKIIIIVQEKGINGALEYNYDSVGEITDTLAYMMLRIMDIGEWKPEYYEKFAELVHNLLDAYTYMKREETEEINQD